VASSSHPTTSAVAHCFSRPIGRGGKSANGEMGNTEVKTSTTTIRGVNHLSQQITIQIRLAQVGLWRGSQRATG
jgi:hypothetical protein